MQREHSTATRFATTSALFRRARFFSAILAMMLLGCVEPAGSDWPSAVADGGSCEKDWDCASGICFAAVRDGVVTGWDEGLCTRPCDSGGGCAEGLACAPLDGGAWCLPACRASADCRAGYVCNEAFGACLPDCRLDFDCGPLLSCGEEGVCVASPGELRALGEPCEWALDCASGICFAETRDGLATGWPGGFCSEPCGAGGICGEGMTCAPLDGVGWCLSACAADTDCREGYLCQAGFEACMPDCRLGFDCGAVLVCGADGRCDFAPPPLEALGGPCDSAVDCETGWCFSATEDGSPTGWVGGMCTVPCAAGACPEGAVCAVLEGVGYCLPSCTPAAWPLPGLPERGDCRTDYACDPDFEACLPSCKNEGWDCGAQYVCRADGVCTSFAPGRP